VVLLLLISGCGRQSELLGRVSEADANASIRVLRERGIVAEKVQRKEGVSVTVAPDDAVAALDVLNAHGLPRGATTSLGDVFKREGMVSTPLEERARLVHALSKELEGIIEAIDGVVVARVLVVLPDRAVPGEAPKPPSASVFVKHRSGLDPDMIQPHIAKLVGSAVPGLAGSWRERVTVVFVQGVELAARPTPAASAASTKSVPVVVGSAAAAVLLALAAGILWVVRNPKALRFAGGVDATGSDTPAGRDKA
jgi:type III secretion protein J